MPSRQRSSRVPSANSMEMMTESGVTQVSKTRKRWGWRMPLMISMPRISRSASRPIQGTNFMARSRPLGPETFPHFAKAAAPQRLQQVEGRHGGNQGKVPSPAPGNGQGKKAFGFELGGRHEIGPMAVGRAQPKTQGNPQNQEYAQPYPYLIIVDGENEARV